ncbi:MAG: hypothetical protein P8Q42_11285 [Flavobacteriales bacterium]|nr:hypothetical protein [Flavobacteriales bacterium]
MRVLISTALISVLVFSCSYTTSFTIVNKTNELVSITYNTLSSQRSVAIFKTSKGDLSTRKGEFLRRINLSSENKIIIQPNEIFVKTSVSRPITPKKYLKTLHQYRKSRSLAKPTVQFITAIQSSKQWKKLTTMNTA